MLDVSSRRLLFVFCFFFNNITIFELAVALDMDTVAPSSLEADFYLVPSGGWVTWTLMPRWNWGRMERKQDWAAVT